MGIDQCPSNIEIKLLQPGDEAVLARVADGVFDQHVDQRLTREFLNDPRHHLVVAIDAGCVVGMASAVHYVHPDKQPELWINEVGVSPAHRNRGIGKALMETLLQLGRDLKCTQAWVLTSRTNAAAMRLYASTGGVAAPEESVMFTFRLDGNDPIPV